MAEREHFHQLDNTNVLQIQKKTAEMFLEDDKVLNKTWTHEVTELFFPKMVRVDGSVIILRPFEESLKV